MIFIKSESMELIKSIKIALHFISVVQESCDIHRKCMDRLWMEEYDTYINNWKQNQIELKKKHAEVKKCENNYIKGEDFEELEELAIADSLLRKAKNIRMKNQKALNGIIDSMNVPTPNFVPNVPNTKPILHISDKIKPKKRVHQSKSDFIISRNKSSAVPRSKSASGTLVQKESFKSHNKNTKFTSLSAKCQTKSSEKTLDDQTVISSKDLDALKRLHVSMPICHEIKSTKYYSRVSDSSENSLEHHIPHHSSSREFLNAVKEKLNAVSSHFQLKVWYPFMSSKSDILLTSVECGAVYTLKRTSTVLYIIQETMMWIDLLYLMENEIYPNVAFDMKDTKKLRVCSYLLSIFNQNGQRIPMLNPNR